MGPHCRTPLYAVSLLAASCAAPTEQGTPEADLEKASDERRVVYGRVHDSADLNIGLAGIDVQLGEVSIASDASGQFRIEGPADADVLRVDGSGDGWAPQVLHLPDGAPEIEVWPGLILRSDADLLASIMAGTSDIQPSYDPNVAYIITQVGHVDHVNSWTEPGTVAYWVDGAKAEDVFVSVYNEALDACLPRRTDDWPAVADPACGSLVVVPGVSPGAEVRVQIEHPERLCARTNEARVAGDVAQSFDYTIRAVADGLNMTGVECHVPK